MERTESGALGAIQESLWRLVTEPEGVEAALAGGGHAARAEVAALVRGDLGVGPGERLAVYANAYFARIHDCLRDDFGALACALGPAAFHDLVKTYLIAHPPTRPSLRHAGGHLAAHLATEPFATIFSRVCPYGADLARLEWAMMEAFYAADSRVLGREHLATVAPGDWASLRFELVPSFELLSCAWPVHGVRAHFDREPGEPAREEAPRLAAEATHLRVWRQGERVRYQAISRLEREALAAVQARETFGEVCERLASARGEADAAPEAAALLSSWVSDGLLARLL